MSDTASTTGVPDSTALSPVERVVNTYIEPSKTFEDIKRNRSWWLPFVILLVLGWIFCYGAMKHVGGDMMATNILKSQLRRHR
jgi:ATP-dependent Zn protease